jgi:hypothetical protein
MKQVSLYLFILDVHYDIPITLLKKKNNASQRGIVATQKY